MYKVWTDGTLNGKDIVRRVETEEDGGIEYPAIPEQPIPTGRQTPILVRDPVSGELQWVETDRGPTDQEKIEDLKVENATLNERLAQTNGNFTAFQDFYFEQNPTQA